MQQEQQNTITLPYLSSLEERWMCGLSLGNEGPRPFRCFLSESERPQSAPWGPLNWLLLLGKIDWERNKWPPSNCLTEMQHIRPTGWHNLGLILLPRDVCNPIPLHLHFDPHSSQTLCSPAPSLPAGASSAHWNSIYNGCLNSRPVWTQSLTKSRVC